jgi:FKBP-type peptidyl-prolyl cis-trans isomerase FkpA
MSKRNTEGRAPASAPMIESLESRELLSHTVSATRLTFSTTGTSGTLANPIGITVAAKLTANGLPLRTANIFFVIDGQTSIGQGQTGRSGYATAILPNLPAGKHSFAAFFVGATRYVASQSRAVSLTETPPGFTTTADGLQFATITAGSGATPTTGQTAHVNYAGYFTNNTLFDTSLGRTSVTAGESIVDGGSTLGVVIDAPINTPGSVIAGFNEGVKGMKPGETRVLVIPPQLAYGVTSTNPNIPDNSTLIFYVKLESIT